MPSQPSSGIRYQVSGIGDGQFWHNNWSIWDMWECARIYRIRSQECCLWSLVPWFLGFLFTFQLSCTADPGQEVFISFSTHSTYHLAAACLSVVSAALSTLRIRLSPDDPFTFGRKRMKYVRLHMRLLLIRYLCCFETPATYYELTSS